MAARGIRISKVAENSFGSRLGLAPGDEILSVDGNEIEDELALRFHLAGDWAELRVRRTDGVEELLEADLSGGPGLGVEVEDFRTRTCSNRCLFCFVDQLPPSARPSLRIKDDDYRLSFLHGNYITLTNLRRKDLDRIVGQRLSPLYVSVHATDPQLRARLLGRRRIDDLEGKMRRLIEGGIRLHAQIVLVPGLNDGGNLRKTVSDLYRRHPGVASAAIVPLGLSGHGNPRKILEPVTPDFCRSVIRQVRPWQERFRRETGRTFAYLADEFYIQGGEPIPGREVYDDFEQIEDGIGMTRSFLDDLDAALARRRKSRPRLHGTLATGRLFFPFLREAAERIRRKLDCRLEVAEVENRFLGSSVTVAGLLSAGDFEASLRGRNLGDFVVVPGEAVSGAGVFLDDATPKDLSRRLGKPVYSSARTAGDLLRLLSRISR